MAKVLNNILSLLIGLCILAPSSLKADVILHAFNWKYSEISEKSSEISALGYKKVLVSPPYKSSGKEWWGRYQPQDYRVIDSPLGNKEDFVEMIQLLRSKGVEVYADVVLNHMANESWMRTDLNYPNEKVLADYNQRAEYFENNKLFGNLSHKIFSAGDFHDANCIVDYNDVWSVQHHRLCGGSDDPGLPDLNANDWVVQQQRRYVLALKKLGVTGMRIDAAKHMTFDQIHRIFTPEVSDGLYLFGELITHGGRGYLEYDRFLKPYIDNTVHNAYDFPLFTTIRSAFNFDGSFTSLDSPEYEEQALDPKRSISFAVTHDIVQNEGFRHLILHKVDEELAYGYLIASGKTTPLVYSDHGESGKDVRWIDAYKSKHLAKLISFHNQTLNQDSEIIADSNCYLLIKRGTKGFAGVNKCGDDFDVSIHRSQLPKNAMYKDVMTGKLLSLDGNFKLPARSVALWLKAD